MSRSWWGRFLICLFFIVLSGVYVFPSLTNLDLEKSSFPFKQKINLGLDLQGGLYMVLGVDLNKVYREILTRQVSSLEARLKEKAISLQKSRLADPAQFAPEDPRSSLDFDIKDRDEVYQILKKEFWTLRLTGEDPGHFELGLSIDSRHDIRDRTVGQSIEVIRNRIDEFGVTEPQIASQGNDRIVVELPGVREVDRAKELIGRTAKLEFKIVDDKTLTPTQLAQLISEIEKAKGISLKEGQKFSDYVQQLNQFAKGKIPEDEEIAFERVRSENSLEVGESRLPYLLHTQAQVTGNDLQEATVQIDPDSRRPTVGFVLNPRGASEFERLTGANVGNRLAIVLDNLVHSAPVIQTQIGGRGQISLGRMGANPDHFMKEAKDLAIVLRAGALPAQLEFLEQRVVGPSLGQDSIKKGAFASILGSLAVFLFVLFYYRISGAIAVFSLMLNVLFVLALLVGFDATLTLPGIAGIALTVGIAVDSNVVIYERIREELRAGKRPASAVESGFQKAFHTILDANVTNALAAIVLLTYGTGPIKGFAVTLMIGIVTTLFTAVFVCRVIFDLYLKVLEKRKIKVLSI